MKSKLQKILLCFFAVVLLLTSTTPAFAENATRNVNEAQYFIDGIVAYQQEKAGVSSVQGWINGTLTQNAGSSSEWYVIALSQYADYDFSSYKKSLLNYLNNNEVASASSRQKYALALIACGSIDEYIYAVLNNSIGEQGVMSWIFGLHLLNNGYTSNNYSLTAVKKKLLSLQLSDGGWAVTGSNSDVDVTAMVIQALAPYYKADTSVKNAVNKALTLLSERQKENGDWASYGVNNPESTAQVLVALSSLGIDCKTDSRFIKNGNTLFDGIEMYRLSNGSFCHKKGGASNGTATVQVFYSMVSYMRMKNGKSSLYVLDARNPSGLQIPNIETSKNDDKQDSSNTEVNFGKEKSSSKKKVTNKKQSQRETSTNTSKRISDNINNESKNITNNVTKESDSSKEKDVSEDVNVPEKTKNYQTNIKETLSSEETSQKNNDNLTSFVKKETDGVSYKVWVCCLIIIITGVICIFLYFRNKRNIHNYIVIGIIALVAIILTLVTNFQSNDDYYNKAGSSKQNAIGTVSITIRCDTIPDKSADHIPDDGIILNVSEFEIEEDDTVYDVLSEAAAKNKIHLETSGSGDAIYVEGISNIYEFDFGDLSGWMYFVNDKSPSIGCGEYVLSDSDEIKWLYTCDIGKDIEN